MYEKGKQVCSIADFETTKTDMFWISVWKNPVRHRSFLISWPYWTLKNFIDHGHVYEAVRKDRKP